MLRIMIERSRLKQGTIICQVCEKVIAIVDSPEGVKTWYGICKDCSIYVFTDWSVESMNKNLNKHTQCFLKEEEL